MLIPALYEKAQAPGSDEYRLRAPRHCGQPGVFLALDILAAICLTMAALSAARF